MYIVLIQTSPTAEYQTYRGWDAVYPTRYAAEKVRARARAQFNDAKVVQVPEDES